MNEARLSERSTEVQGVRRWKPFPTAVPARRGGPDRARGGTPRASEKEEGLHGKLEQQENT